MDTLSAVGSLVLIYTSIHTYIHLYIYTTIAEISHSESKWNKGWKVVRELNCYCLKFSTNVTASGQRSVEKERIRSLRHAREI